MSIPESLLQEFDAEARKKWRWVRKLWGSRLNAYSPRRGDREDTRLRQETSKEVLGWSREWFRVRGYDVVCEVLEDGESIAVRYPEREGVS
jgi:hypothetical protein